MPCMAALHGGPHTHPGTLRPPYWAAAARQRRHALRRHALRRHALRARRHRWRHPAHAHSHVRRGDSCGLLEHHPPGSRYEGRRLAVARLDAPNAVADEPVLLPQRLEQ